MGLKKYFIFGDVHGEWSILHRELRNAGFDEKNEDHWIINLGDLFDRGKQNGAVLEFIIKMMDRDRIINIAGNHDDFLVDLCGPRDFVDFNITYNGFGRTVAEFAGVSYETMLMFKVGDPEQYQAIMRNAAAQPNVKRLLKSLVDEVQLAGYSFTHAGKSLEKGEWVVCNWTRSPEFVQTYPDDGFINVFGHWGAHKLRSELNAAPISETLLCGDNYRPFVSDNGRFVGIDAWSGVSDRINVMVIETNEIPLIKKSR